MDVASVDQIRESVDRAAALYGGLDILVNCVGIQREEPLLEVTEEAFDEVYEVNLKAAMFLAQAAAKHQVAAGRGGKQVHLLSVRSQLGLRNRGYSAYCSTKGALVMLVKQHAMELAPHGITVNGVAPTFVYTEMIRHVMENPEFRKTLHDRIPLGRIADPKDVSGPVHFFCAPASDFVTGQTLYVDGGITASQ
jgi:gluconate 5-dehydrogenase